MKFPLINTQFSSIESPDGTLNFFTFAAPLSFCRSAETSAVKRLKLAHNKRNEPRVTITGGLLLQKHRIRGF